MSAKHNILPGVLALLCGCSHTLRQARPDEPRGVLDVSFVHPDEGWATLDVPVTAGARLKALLVSSAPGECHGCLVSDWDARSCPQPSP